jgi:hypothetical protein
MVNGKIREKLKQLQNEMSLVFQHLTKTGRIDSNGRFMEAYLKLKNNSFIS